MTEGGGGVGEEHADWLARSCAPYWVSLAVGSRAVGASTVSVLGLDFFLDLGMRSVAP